MLALVAAALFVVGAILDVIDEGEEFVMVLVCVGLALLAVHVSGRFAERRVP